MRTLGRTFLLLAVLGSGQAYAQGPGPISPAPTPSTYRCDRSLPWDVEIARGVGENGHLLVEGGTDAYWAVTRTNPSNTPVPEVTIEYVRANNTTGRVTLGVGEARIIEAQRLTVRARIADASRASRATGSFGPCPGR